MPIDTRNKFGVQRTALGPVLQNPPVKGAAMSADDALNLASYLLVSAGQSAEVFETTLEAVCDRIAEQSPTKSAPS